MYEKNLGTRPYTIGCSVCGKLAKRNGKQCGKQRYQCVTCGHSFIRHRKQSASLVDFKAFFSFILGNKNRLQTTLDKRISRKTLSRVFLQFFTHPPSVEEVLTVFPLTSTDPWVLALDGTWLKRQGVIMIYWNHTAGESAYWSWERSESYVVIATGLMQLVQLVGVTHPPVGVVSDWKGSIVANVEQYLGSVPHQRCLAHVKREIERLLPRHSPFVATQELRSIGLALMDVQTTEQKNQWQERLCYWQLDFSSVLTERSVPEEPTKTKRKWWYTHSNVRRAFRILIKDQHHLFEHLNYSFLPSTNNGLEGINGDLKTKLRNHRGMKAEQQYQFVCWYLTFKKVKKPADLKRLWDMWNRLK